MNVSAYIARRYLFSRKRTNIINVISIISTVVVAGVSAAMIIILSAFNGIEALVETLFSRFEADLTVLPVTGKTIPTDSLDTADFLEVAGVARVSRVVEEDAWLQYVNPIGEPSNVAATIKGIDTTYAAMTQVDTMIVWGDFSLGEPGAPQVIPGLGVLSELGVPLSSPDPQYILINAPQRGKRLSKFKENAFARHPAQVSGVFSINADLDVRYLVASVDACQEWFGYEKEISGFEIQVAPEADFVQVQAEIAALLPEGLAQVENRFERNALIYQTNKSEKWATYLILLFILLIAAFNIVASLTMLIIEKKRDIFILRSLGVPENGIRRVFALEGIFIYFIGAITGIVLGTLVCWAQQTFGLIRLQGAMVEYYPVKIDAMDMVGVVVTVMLVGMVFSTALVRMLLKRFAL